MSNKTTAAGWDDTVHDLSRLKLTPSEMRRKRENKQKYSPANALSPTPPKQSSIIENTQESPVNWKALKSVLQSAFESDGKENESARLHVNQEISSSGVLLTQQQVDIDSEISRFLGSAPTRLDDQKGRSATSKEWKDPEWPAEAGNRLTQSMKQAFPDNRLPAVTNSESLVEYMAFMADRMGQHILANNLQRERGRLALEELKRGQRCIFDQLDELRAEMEVLAVQQTTNTNVLTSTSDHLGRVAVIADKLEAKVRDIEYQMCGDLLASNID